MCDFLTLKNVTISSGVYQNKKSPSFWPIGQKMFILHDNFVFSMARQFWPMGQKDGDFLFWSRPEPMITFLGLKNHISP